MALGAALACLGGAWTALLLWILTAAARDHRPQGQGRTPSGGEDPPSREEAARAAAMQEGFDNLMRYTAATAARGEPPREEL